MHRTIDSQIGSTKLCINTCSSCSNVRECMCMASPRRVPNLPRHLEGGGSPCLALLP